MIGTCFIFLMNWIFRYLHLFWFLQWWIKLNLMLQLQQLLHHRLLQCWIKLFLMLHLLQLLQILLRFLSHRSLALRMLHLQRLPWS